jgi:spore coat polysaccharide biosynthesis protein SpsF
MTTGVFLQVRLDSTRLPRKALLPIGPRSVIEHAMAALGHVRADVRALVTDAAGAEALRPYALSWGFGVYVGDPNDVLNRYACAARHFGVDTIVRATGDNPFVSSELADMIVDEYRRAAADYAGYDGIPLGTGVEVLRAHALIEADRLATDPYDREHVSPYLYRHPSRFRIHRIGAPARYCGEGRVTLDTQEDYAFLVSLWNRSRPNGPLSIRELLRLLAQIAPVRTSA